MESIVKAMIERAVDQARELGATRDMLRYVLRCVTKALPADTPVVSTDGIDRWIEERCDRLPGEAVASSTLYDSYITSGGDPLSKQTFGRALTARGFIRKNDSSGCYWYGLILKGTSYRNAIENWIAAECSIHPYARLPSKQLHEAFSAWSGVKLSKQRFNAVLDDLGYVREGYVWRGLTTKAALMTSAELLEQERAACVARNQGGVTL
jgi:hypothetical protein